LVALDGAPFNTHSETSLYNPLYYGRLLRNFPLWVSDDLMLNFSFPTFLRRVRNKLIALAESLSVALRGRREVRRQVEGFLDLSDYSPSQQAFMNALYNALLRYVPKPYASRALVYKARTQPLYHLWEVERAWRKIAVHVDIVVVRGTHESIVREPYIVPIAEDLRKRLERIRVRTDDLMAIA
jgi:hypothetical protein